MSNKFPSRKPEKHEMKHIGDGEYFCPICYRQVKLENGVPRLMKDEKGKPMVGDPFAVHFGSTVDGIELELTNTSRVELDDDVWGDALDGLW